MAGPTHELALGIMIAPTTPLRPMQEEGDIVLTDDMTDK